MSKKLKKLPSIYLDENVVPEVVAALRIDFRAFEISKQVKFKGRDEKSYINELYSVNGVFVTSDREFVDYVLENNIKHAGIIFLPEQMSSNEKALFAEMVGAFIRGGCTFSPFVFRNFLFYPASDGLHSINKGEDKLEVSWDELSE